MRVTYRIPTEMYAYVEITDELGLKYAPDEIARDYQQYVDAFKPNPLNSLPIKDFNAFLDMMLMGKPNHVDMYEKLSPKQAEIVNEIKKSLKRLGK